eukprot:8467213-Ditylum_brightwellii.AAC.1
MGSDKSGVGYIARKDTTDLGPNMDLLSTCGDISASISGDQTWTDIGQGYRIDVKSLDQHQ